MSEFLPPLISPLSQTGEMANFPRNFFSPTSFAPHFLRSKHMLSFLLIQTTAVQLSMAAAATVSAIPPNQRRNTNAVGDIEFETTQGVEPILSFENMVIKEDLLRGIYAYGFEKPSAIQQRAVRPFIEGRDVIAQAQSGTGKTSMISLTVCQMVDTSTREVQALVLSPTRELASQTEKVILAIGDYINIQAHSFIGGKSVGEDIRKLESGVHVVSGTPGRVCDMIKRRTLRTRAIKLLVLASP